MSWELLGYPQVVLAIWCPVAVLGLWRLVLPLLVRLRPQERFTATFVLCSIPLVAVFVPYLPYSALREALPWRAPIAWGVSNMPTEAGEPFAVALTLVLLSTVPFISIAVSALYAVVQLRSALRVAGAQVTASRGELAVVKTPGFVACTVGLIRPRILVGSDVIDSPFMATILEHERAHARHRHALWIFIATVILRSWWWVPGRRAMLDDLALSAELWADGDARASHGAGAVAGALAAHATGNAAPPLRSPLAGAAFIDPLVSLTRRAQALSAPAITMHRPGRVAVRATTIAAALIIIVLL